MLTATLFPDLQLRSGDDDDDLVYYMQLDHFVKIGHGDPPARRRTFQTTNQKPIQILATEPGGAAVEELRHVQFDVFHVPGAGRELFRPDPALLFAIQGIADIQHLHKHHMGILSDVTEMGVRAIEELVDRLDQRIAFSNQWREHAETLMPMVEELLELNHQLRRTNHILGATIVGYACSRYLDQRYR